MRSGDFVKRRVILLYPVNPFPKERILDFSKLKEFADDNFKFDENGRKFSKWVENIMRKGEIAFPQCFQNTYTADTEKTRAIKRILKINKSWPELFNFQDAFNCH